MMDNARNLKHCTSDLYSGGAQFESQLRYQLS
jgi:hypothetical protein